MNRKKKKVILLLATIFSVGLAVALLWPRNEEPVIVKGHLSAADIKEIKPAAWKALRSLEWKAFKWNFMHMQFRNVLRQINFFHRCKLTEIVAIRYDDVFVHYQQGEALLTVHVERKTNTWQESPMP